MQDKSDFGASASRGYGLSTSQKILYLAMAGVWLAGAGFFLRLAVDPVGRDFALSIGALSAAPGIIFALAALRSRLLLGADRISVRHALREFSATRDEIEGQRTLENRYGNRRQICLKGGARFTVLESFACGDALRLWLRDVPNLDEADRERLVGRIEGVAGGPERDTGTATPVEVAARWSTALAVAAGVAGLIAIFVQARVVRGPAILLSAVLPLVAGVMLLRASDLFTIFRRASDPRADLALVLVIPALSLAVANHVSWDAAQLVEPFSAVGWVLAFMLVYLVVPCHTAWKLPTRLGGLVLLLIFAAFYAAGLTRSADILADGSAPALYEPAVVGKWAAGRDYNLRLSAFGRFSDPPDVSVPPSFFSGVAVGTRVCVYVHAGFLRSAWLTVREGRASVPGAARESPPGGVERFCPPADVP